MAGPLIRITATAGLMVYALRGIEWGTFRDLLARADWTWWACGLAVGMGLQVVGGIRWAVLARPLGFPLSYGAFVWRFLEGSFFSLCLPSSIGGDVVKAYRLGDTTPRRLLAACSVLADRLTGVSALGVLAMTALLVTRLWEERRHGGIIELHVAGGSVILPEWFEPRWSGGTHGLFASRAADGTVTLTAVAWEAVQKIVVRQVDGLPDGMFE